MQRISEAIEVGVPIEVAYDQWTQFETFPQFMDGVERVVQLSDTMLDWTATIGGQTRHWRARIVEQEPDARIAWQSLDGARNDGAVSFQALGPDRTRIALDLDVEPAGRLEATGTALGFVSRRVKGDLERFKAFIEARHEPTGAWRGRVEQRRPR